MQRPWPMLKALLVVRRGILTQTAFVQCTTLHACTTPASSRAPVLQSWVAASSCLRCRTQVPLPLRDAVYDVIAERRYQWFGRSARCQVPPTDVLDRFLDAEELVQGRCSGEALPADPFREAREEVWQRWTRR